MLTMSTVCFAQSRKPRQYPKYNPQTGAYYNNFPICFLDTISIQDPILIRFNAKSPQDVVYSSDRGILLLVSKSTLDSNTGDSVDFMKYLLNKDTYLCYDASGFMRILKSNSPEIKNFPYYSDFIKHYDEDKEICVIKQDTITFKVYDEKIRKDTVITELVSSKPKKYKGWWSYEVVPKKFLLCLVKGSLVYKNQSVEEYIFLDKLDNAYLKVLVPITW